MSREASDALDRAIAGEEMSPDAETNLSRTFEELAMRHTARHGFRSYDLIHVASARVLGCDSFWSCDTKATKLVRLEGLGTLG